MKLVGYHATVTPLRNILNGDKLKRKQFDALALPGDLGTGTYFFKDNPELAKQFLEKMHPGEQIKVVKCTIEVDDETVLDFNEPESQVMFNDFKQLKLEQATKTFAKLKGNRYCIDGIIINLLISAIRAQDKTNIKLVIKDTFTPTKELFAKGRFLTSNFVNGTELCVIDHNIVTKGEEYNGV